MGSLQAGPMIMDLSCYACNRLICLARFSFTCRIISKCGCFGAFSLYTSSDARIENMSENFPENQKKSREGPTKCG